jgi:hypothetical protein
VFLIAVSLVQSLLGDGAFAVSRVFPASTLQPKLQS